jgi:hypothetical protein
LAIRVNVWGIIPSRNIGSTNPVLVISRHDHRAAGRDLIGPTTPPRAGRTT